MVFAGSRAEGGSTWIDPKTHGIWRHREIIFPGQKKGLARAPFGDVKSCRCAGAAFLGADEVAGRGIGFDHDLQPETGVVRCC